ncbi:MAG TPA: type II toxin-antitoxin system VapB family antitoxin [Nakamurella sp.]|jgi:antitoxin VapB
MALSIKNPEAELLVRRLTAHTGETATRAIIVALQERLDRIDRSADAAAAKAARLRRISADAAGRWIEPYRSSEHGEILYDENGLPR